MYFRIIYDSDFSRIIPSVIADSRVNIPSILSVSGSVLKAFVDLEVALVKDISNRIFYKIETDKGNLAGYFIVEVNTLNQSAFVFKKQLRPAFVQFDTEISNEVNTFMYLFTWKKDFLF